MDQNFGNLEIEPWIFQENDPLAFILRKCLEAYEFSNSKEQSIHPLYIDDLKLYGKTDKGLNSSIQTVRIFSSDICMEFGIKNCNRLILKRGIKDENYDIILPNNLKISSLKEAENYKYPGILEAENINTRKMNEKVKTEYLGCTRKVLESKRNGENLFKAIN